MFKYVIVLMVVSHLIQAQKSFYAGRQPWYPKVLPQYMSTTSTTAAPGTTELGSLDNRIGANTVSPAPVDPSFPVDSVDDFERFLQRVASWPVDKQPFWYRNREAIWQQINRGVDAGNTQQPSGFNNMRSPFAGRG